MSQREERATVASPAVDIVSVPPPPRSPLADLVDDGDVGEEVMVLRVRHRPLQSFAVSEVMDQDAQAVQIRVLRRDDLEDGL